MISIHASRGGSDTGDCWVEGFVSKFQSTLPAGEATLVICQLRSIPENFNPRFPRGKRREDFGMKPSDFHISIHASRGGSDRSIYTAPCRDSHFNPRFPRGKRRRTDSKILTLKSISIHASRGGSDSLEFHKTGNASRFQSTLPAGEATVVHPIDTAETQFQSTLPAGEATGSFACITAPSDFNPRFPRGKRPS